MSVKNLCALVYGMSSSGEWVSKLLKKKGANVFLYDEDKAKLRSKSCSGCYIVMELTRKVISELDFIVVSPAIEKDNPHILLANELNIKVYSEVEFASLFCKNMVAITGTNGKTTTVELITAVLNKKHRAVACGNIGYPLSRAVLEKKRDIKVVEVSSFMLEHCEKFHPHVTTVLNIAEDHLIRHKSMAEYKRLKMKIFSNLTPSDYAVINLDTDIVVTHDCNIVTYSIKHSADVCVINGYIYAYNTPIISVSELKLKGAHNLSNVLCAIAYGCIYKVKLEKIRDAILSFEPDNYRIEYIGSVKGVNFYNDSKSTNIASTLACCETIKGSIVLLLGGSKKDLDYSTLFNKLTKRVKKIVVYGEIADELVKANEDKFPLNKTQTLKQAFEEAVKTAKKNDSVVLSPSSASYDQFSSYMERGRAFNELVREYEIKEKKV